jgi:regulator of replication initiation timing
MYQCDIENKKLINRINRILGQVNSLKKWLESEIGENHDHQYAVQKMRVRLWHRWML